MWLVFLFLLLLAVYGASGGDDDANEQTVLVLKYVIQNYPLQTLYFGIANVIANSLVMLRFVLPPV